MKEKGHLFAKMETYRLIIYIALCLSFFGLDIALLASHPSLFITFASMFLFALLLAGMVYFYYTLASLIQQYHPQRYEEIKDSMKFFFLIETIPLSASVLC
jgi:hypothetical protein